MKILNKVRGTKVDEFYVEFFFITEFYVDGVGNQEQEKTTKTS
jgi:hypothetical protein